MNSILLFAFSFVPIVIIFIYFKKGHIEKDKKKQLIKIFIAEMLLAIIDIGIETFIDENFILNNNMYTMLLYYILGVGLVEEITKFIPAYIFGIRNKKYQTFYDIIIFCFFSVLGFAQIENFGYLLGAKNTITTGVLRILLCIPGHAIYSILMGLLFGIAIRYKNEKNNIRFIIYMFLSFILPSSIHGLYDFTISSGNGLVQFISIASESLLCIYLLSKTLELHKNNKYDEENKKFKQLGKKILELAFGLLVVILVILNLSEQNFQYTDGKVGIGEELAIDDVDIVVNSIEEYNYQDSNKLNNGNYVKVNITVNNNSKNEFYTDMIISGTFVLANKSGEEFNSNTMINTLNSIVNSGENVTGDLYFKTQLSNKMRIVYYKYDNSFKKTKYFININ